MSAAREVSILEIDDKKTETYEWTFHVPPKRRIQENILAMDSRGFCFNNLKFHKGTLASIEHSWGVSIYSNQINAYLTLPRKSRGVKLVPCTGKLELFSKSDVKSTHRLRFRTDETGNNPNAPINASLWSASWIHVDQSWDDTVDLLKITLAIEIETAGRCINAGDGPRWEQRSLMNLMTRDIDLKCDSRDFFMSPNLSDVELICGNQSFHAHKFLLSCKSPVFNRMFENNMKESTEGKVVIEDMDPPILKEFLRFLYGGGVDNLTSYSLELFIAANKYDILPLKKICETLLCMHVTPSNAMHMYALGDTHGGTVLKETALNILKSHKTSVISDCNTFREFSQQYPELMYELYKL